MSLNFFSYYFLLYKDGIHLQVSYLIHSHVEWSQGTIELINTNKATLSLIVSLHTDYSIYKEGYVLSKYSKTLKRLKRLAPKVPDYTCPDIDFIVDKVENNNKGFTKFRKKLLVRKLERLRIQNEQLRESGEYWYKKLRDYLVDFLD